MGSSVSSESLKFVDALLVLRDKFDAIIATAFENDKAFHNGEKKALEYVLSLDSRSPEYISLFLDSLLRASGRGGAAAISEDSIETSIEKVMPLFRLLQDKDVFERYYKQHLAKRLLSDRSFSDDLERKVILLLKVRFSYKSCK